MKTQQHKKLLKKRTQRIHKRKWMRINEERGSVVFRRVNKAQFFKNQAAEKKARLKAQKEGKTK
jgi:hypothetical protein